MTRNVLNYLENSALLYPQKAAVREENTEISFSLLMEESRRIGSALAKIAERGKPVGVFAEKGIDALCSFFGIVYAGAFYTMLNTELPDSRLKQIQSVLDAKIIITTDALKDRASALFGKISVYTVDDLRKTEIDGAALDDIRDGAVDSDPLYINFTSGSTGVPKGIVVSHRSVIDFIDCFTDIFSITQNDIIANQAPFDFDVSVKDIYSFVKTGATLVIVPRRLFSAPAALIDCLCENKVTTLIWAVSALCLVSTFHGLDYKTPQSVKKILFSGEVMPHRHLCEWQKHLPDALYANLYGPTEITCNCTYHILSRDRDYSAGIPIGRHFPNEDVFLLDDNDRKITGKGVTGRIFVRGTALALGYYRLAEKNAESFINNPLNKDYPELVYQTGDLGRLDDNGELVFCGRKDNQVKYLGHRIELEEIERAMSEIEGIERCFCVFDEEKSRLKGFYVGSVDKDVLHAIMCETMPTFMVPGYLRRLDEIPMTKNGKIDRKILCLQTGGLKK